MFFELSKRCAANVERALQIDIDNSSEAVGRELLSSTKKVAGRAVNNDIDLAEMFDRLCDGFFNFFRMTNVRGNWQRFAAFLIDCVSGRLEVIHLPAYKRNAGA